MILGRVSLFLASGTVLFVAACGGGGNNTQQHNPVTPTVTVTPASSSISTTQSLSVSVTVTGSAGTPTGSVILKGGSYTSTSAVLSAGIASFSIPAGSLAAGSDSLAASYTPDSAGSTNYTTGSGSGSVTVNKTTPTVTVSPGSNSISATQVLSVSITVSGGSGAPVVTGSVTLSGGSFTSPAATLTNGAATISIPAGTLAAGNVTLTAAFSPDTSGAATYNGGSGAANVTVTSGKVTPTVTVSPATPNINTQQSVSVTVTVSGGSGNPTATGSVVLTSGAYTSSATTLSSGSAVIDIPSATLTPGSDTLTAGYTPDTAGAANYNSASGTGNVTVTRITPAVKITPSSLNVTTAQSLSIQVDVSAPAGDATPTGSVLLTSGSYKSSAVALSSGSASVVIPSGTLSPGSYSFTAAYTPDAPGSAIYTASSATSSSVTVTLLSTVNVNQAVSGPVITDQLLGVNMASWFDPTTSYVIPSLQAAGIKALRWPGGSWSDIYHWNGNFTCQGTPPNLSTGGWAQPNALYTDFINQLEIPGSFDVALTADYGTNSACTSGGDPTEAASWVHAWETAGGTVSHVTVGNEVYGTWETDLHAKPNDPATYAAAVAGASGYYSDIKAVDKNVLVGVVVDAGIINGNWDPTVLSTDKGFYDFVELHYYPRNPGQESDSYLVYNAATDLTGQINTLRQQLKTAGEPDTPIYIGEIGSVSSDPGKQSWSITQGLYAGQAIGEMMNDGVSRLTWWIGFGNCNGDSGNFSSSFYGWQKFGAYNIFADGAGDTGGADNSSCDYGAAPGTMSPTAQAFNLYQHVLVNGESVLTPAVAGDTTDVRAYAATHSGGTALVLFNLNETTAEPVQITLSAENSSSGVTVYTYSKALYDQTNAATPVWAPATKTDLGSQTLPLKLTLDPWSMNVVLIK